MPPAGFEPTIPASERPQRHTFDRAATGTGTDGKYLNKFSVSASLYPKGVLSLLRGNRLTNCAAIKTGEPLMQ
jgi:hypothetical protein